MYAAKISNSGMRTKFQSTGHLHHPMNDISKKIIQFIFHRSVSSMGIIAMIWEKISNKGFSSPNTSYRSLEKPLKVVTLGSLGKTQDGPSKIGGSYTAIICLLKIHVTLLRKVVESSTSTLNCSESSHLVGCSTVSRMSDLYFLSYWATPIF